MTTQWAPCTHAKDGDTHTLTYRALDAIRAATDVYEVPADASTWQRLLYTLAEIRAPQYLPLWQAEVGESLVLRTDDDVVARWLAARVRELRDDEPLTLRVLETTFPTGPLPQWSM